VRCCLSFRWVNLALPFDLLDQGLSWGERKVLRHRMKRDVYISHRLTASPYCEGQSRQEACSSRTIAGLTLAIVMRSSTGENLADLAGEEDALSSHFWLGKIAALCDLRSQLLCDFANPLPAYLNPAPTMQRSQQGRFWRTRHIELSQDLQLATRIHDPG
jgi:hypothetical protein